MGIEVINSPHTLICFTKLFLPNVTSTMELAPFLQKVEVEIVLTTSSSSISKTSRKSPSLWMVSATCVCVCVCAHAHYMLIFIKVVHSGNIAFPTFLPFLECFLKYVWEIAQSCIFFYLIFLWFENNILSRLPSILETRKILLGPGLMSRIVGQDGCLMFCYIIADKEWWASWCIIMV